MAQAMTKTLRSVSKSPLVSVVMSVYNGERYLREAIDSILGQTFKDFEFIIIDDGSTDDTLQIIKSYKDPRIVLISRENKGLVVSLNEGIEQAKGKYIARQDADDYSLPERLRKQLDYMLSHSEVVICGATFTEIDSGGKVLQRIAIPLEDSVIRQELLARCPFAHGSTVYLRKTCLEAGLYKEADFPAEDYALWIRIAALGKMSNLSDNLFNYRVLSTSISRNKANLQVQRTKKIREVAWSKWPFRIRQQPRIWRAICFQPKPREYAKLHYNLLREAVLMGQMGTRFKLYLSSLLGGIYLYINARGQRNG